jgi:predicted negative regulator of RcsB-dependent stress response
MSSPATESTRMIELLAWVEVNKKKLLIGAAVGAVAIGAWSIYGWHRDHAEAEANAALFKVDAPSTGPDNTPGPSADTFLQVAASYPGTSAGGRALLFAADALFRAGKFGDAKTQFEKFLSDYAEHPLAPTAAFGVAACLDAMNKTNEALVAYQDVLTRHGASAVAAQAKMGLARLYETQNSPAQALKLYEEVARLGAQSGWAAEATLQRDRLLSRHPELAKTNAPAVVAAAAATNAPAADASKLAPTNPAAGAESNPK